MKPVISNVLPAGCLILATLLTWIVPSGRAAAQEGPSIRLLSPTGGESFAPGESVIVRWAWRDDLRKKAGAGGTQVEFSGDGGRTWRIAAVKANRDDTMAVWKVPEFGCSDCMLRVLQYSGPISYVPEAIDSITGPGRDDPTNRVSIEFAHTRPLLAVASSDTIYLWDVEKRQLVRQFTSDVLTNGRLTKELMFSDDDRLLFAATVLSSGIVGVWDVETGEQLAWVTKSPSYRRPSLAITPDGDMAVLGGRRPGPLLWNLETGDIDTLEQSLIGYGVGISPDGKTLAVGGFGHIRLYDLASRTLTGRIETGAPEYYATEIHFSPDGAVIAARIDMGQGTDAMSTILVERATGKKIAEYPYYGGVPRSMSLRGDRFLSVTDGLALYERRYPLLHTLPHFAFANPGSIVTGGALSDDGSIAAIAVTSATTGMYTIYLTTVPPLDAMQPVATTAPFTITGSLPFVADLDLGPVELGRVREFPIENFITNTLATAVQVENITVVGESSQSYTVVSGGGPYTLQPGQSMPLTLRFRPEALGKHPAVIEVKTDRGTVRPALNGEGVRQISGADERKRLTHIDASSVGLDLRPNPANGVVTVNWRTREPGMYEMLIYDALGAIVDRRLLGDIAGGDHITAYDAGRLPTGIYRIQLRSEKGGAGGTLVVTH